MSSPIACPNARIFDGSGALPFVGELQVEDKHITVAARLPLRVARDDAREIDCGCTKAGTLKHLEQNLAASALELDASERRLIDARFPPPRRKTPLAMT